MSRLLVLLLSCNFLLLGCTTNAPVSENKPGTVKKQKVLRVQHGTVTSVKDVAVVTKKSNVGGTVGSITGSVLASGTYVGSLLGSLVGSAAGSAVESDLSKKPGLEIGVQLDNGEKLLVTQLASVSFKPGDKVKLVLDDQQAKVIRL